VRKLLRWIGRVFILAVLIGVLAASMLMWPQYRTLLMVGSGYLAQTLCTGHFVSGRTVEAVREDALVAESNPLLRAYRYDVDDAAGTVTVSPLGLPILRRVSVDRPGLGCVLTREDNFDALAARSAPLPDPASAAIWPEGEGADFTPIPALEAALDRAFAEPGEEAVRNTRALVVVRDGRIVGERYAEGITPATPLIGWSMSKAATSALVGIAVAEGRITLDQPVLAGVHPAGDPRAGVTMRNLLGMTDGLTFAEDYGEVTDVSRMLFLEDDMGAFVASRPAEYPPGRRFSYSTGALNLAMAVLRDRFADRDAWLAFPRQALFDPAGMNSAVFETDAADAFVGGAWLYASARDWARFGLLLMNGGVIDGRRVLPEGWTDFMATPVPGSDGRFGSVLWLDSPTEGWVSDLPADMIWLKGHDGQWTAMVPSEGLVIVRLGVTPEETDDIAENVVADVIAALADVPRAAEATPDTAPAPVVAPAG